MDVKNIIAFVNAETKQRDRERKRSSWGSCASHCHGWDIIERTKVSSTRRHSIPYIKKQNNYNESYAKTIFVGDRKTNPNQRDLHAFVSPTMFASFAGRCMISVIFL